MEASVKPGSPPSQSVFAGGASSPSRACEGPVVDHAPVLMEVVFCPDKNYVIVDAATILTLCDIL